MNVVGLKHIVADHTASTLKDIKPSLRTDFWALLFELPSAECIAAMISEDE